MKKLLVVLLAFAAPATAFAGVGATAHLATVNDGTAWAPSLDFRYSGFLVQLDVLNLIGGLPAPDKDAATASWLQDLPHDQLNFGLAGSYVVLKKKCMPDIEGVFMPGLEFRYFGYIGDTGKQYSDAKLTGGGVHALLEGRFGMEMKQGAGFGVYVVPQLGISSIPAIGLKDSKIALVYGGGVEVSAWFLK